MPKRMLSDEERAISKLRRAAKKREYKQKESSKAKAREYDQKRRQTMKRKIEERERYLKRKADPNWIESYNKRKRINRELRKQNVIEVEPQPGTLKSEPQQSMLNNLYDDVKMLTLPKSPILLDLRDPKWKKLEKKFFNAIADGPHHRCHCCDRMFFKTSISTCTKIQLCSKFTSKEDLNFSLSVDMNDKGQFCFTCYNYLRQGKIPPLAANYGFKYAARPECLATLTDLEERLISLRLPFMHIRTLGNDHQFGCKGSVVNVPITLDKTIRYLPMNPNDCETVLVQLKKRIKFKSDYMYGAIVPAKVFKAAQYLLDTDLYQNNNVSIDTEWLEKFKNESFGKVSTKYVDMTQTAGDADMLDNPLVAMDSVPTETLLGNPNIIIAPGENQIPCSLLFDTFGEELAFPTIYCGQPRYFTRQKPPSFQEISNSEIRRYDRRGATPLKILYNYKKSLHFQILTSISNHLWRKTQISDDITSKDMMDPEFVKTMVNQNVVCKFLENIKNTPPYWEKEKKRVFAQIRQFGIPTLFFTVSAAENRWYELIRSLYFAKHGKYLTKQEFSTMKVMDKNILIQQDPVTCALFFEYRVRKMWESFKSVAGPFGRHRIIHFYQRTEFQQRGSPHLHCLLWLEDAPRWPQSKEKDIVLFINKIITCSKDSLYANLQVHRHTLICQRVKKNGKTYCRFNIPFFPMDKTIILSQLQEGEPVDIETHQRIRDYMESVDEKTLNAMTFAEFLQSLKLTYEQYITAIRSGLDRPQVFLHREPSEIWINAYSPKIIQMMQSNMDVHFILDGYTLVSYVVDYINKSNRGLTRDLRKVVEETQGRNLSLHQCFKEVGNQLIRSEQISAQEASWWLLKLPFSNMSEGDIFISTFPPHKGSRMVKSHKELRNLKRDSTDVFEMSIDEKYCSRPEHLEDMCLADFAAWYETCKKGNPENKLKDCNLYIRKRQQPKVILFRKPTDEDEFYRQNIMLYTHWRNEERDISHHSLHAFYEEKLYEISENKKQYVYDSDLDIETELMHLHEMRRLEEEDEEQEINKFLEFEKELEEDLDDKLRPNIERDMEAAHGKDFQTTIGVWMRNVIH